ncbi:chorismate mutase [Waterburya agarophytonicola K14]|uniref:chorismate mutase n=1 Tax=Waterburya agarophytonicola KI4 TaxID=2874699 RepID=A0A964FGW1_9CYAN|nr:chorismate mutase [Waterburya agarophytonicola KI4]
MEWKVRGIRGATTASNNTPGAITDAVNELLEEIETHNQFQPDDIVCVFFTTTADLDAIFPAAVARKRPGWNYVPLIDLQQMHVRGSLQRCIRLLIQINTYSSQSQIVHRYLRDAQALRPDLDTSFTLNN